MFRSENIDVAISMLHGMAGLNGVVLNGAWQAKLGVLGDLLGTAGVVFGDMVALDSVRALRWMLPLVIACWVLPNTQEIMANYRPALDFHAGASSSRIAWRPSLAWGIGVGAFAALSVLLISGKSKFLYFQF